MDVPDEIKREIDFELSKGKALEKRLINDRKYLTHKLMKEWRMRYGNPRLCYYDLDSEMRVRFDEEIKELECDNPLPVKFRSLEMQKHFYNHEGLFADMNSREYKAFIKVYKTSKRASIEKYRKLKKEKNYK